MPAAPGADARSVSVDEEVLELAVVLLGQFSLAFGDEPIGTAAMTVADRLQLSVPMVSLLALKNKLEARNLDLR
ncbi:hypothetical protein [Kitasatospora camelliae]|uniref:Uncharacterized protein n=1 Tax=Kitasatospora camelliae TaxID=3156397 RepID=A0AAU8JT15_9ACTN